MANTQRKANRRKVSFAVGNLEQAQEHLILVGKDYEQGYPDHYALFCQCVQAIDIAKNLVTGLHKCL